MTSQPLTVQEVIEREFKDMPIMIDIASCESEFRQWGSDGTALRGEQNPADKGVFQINATYHREEALKIGMDITTLEGNIAFAKVLYKRNGTRDWNWSKPRWSKGRCKTTYAPQFVAK